MTAKSRRRGLPPLAEGAAIFDGSGQQKARHFTVHFGISLKENYANLRSWVCMKDPAQ